MPTKREPERDLWQFAVIQPRVGEHLVTLDGGAPFPERLVAYGNYANGPAIKLVFGVEAGRPILRSVTFGDVFEDGHPGEAPLTASVVHDLPLGQIIEWTIARAVVTSEVVKRLGDAPSDGPLFTRQEQEDVERRVRAVSARGRPVDDETLRRVGEIVKGNQFNYREDIKSELHVSDRTASRYVAAAKNRGFLDKGSDK